MGRVAGTGAHGASPSARKPSKKARLAAARVEREARRATRSATPIVTEHTRGQAHPGPDTRGYRDFLPSDYGQSLNPPRSTPAQIAAYNAAHPHPFGRVGSTLDLLLRVVGGAGGGVTPQGRTNQAGVPADVILQTLGKQLQEDFRHPRQHKLNVALDLASIPSGGVGGVARLNAAAKAARAAEEGSKTLEAMRALGTRQLPSDVLPHKLLPDESGVRKVRLGGGHVQPHESPNILTAAAQHSFDRWSEAHPAAPLVGAASRVTRRLPKERAAAHARVTAEGIPFAVAHKAVSARQPGRVSAREVAANRLIDYGHKDPAAAAKLLEQEIAMRHERLARPVLTRAQLRELRTVPKAERSAAQEAMLKKTGSITPEEAKAQKRLIPQLEAALKHVSNPDVEVQTLAREGAKLSSKSSALAVASGELKPETAAARLDLHPRLIHGAEYVPPTPGRLGVSPKLDAAKARRDRLQKLYDRAVARETPTAEKAMYAPLMSPTIERLGGALSVEKDRVQRLEAAVAGRTAETGIVGGYVNVGKDRRGASYRIQHQSPGPESGVPLNDLAGGTIYPDDIYAKATQTRYYGTGDEPMDRKTFAIVNGTKGKPDATVTIYRGAPKNVTSMEPGDWVTLNSDYAAQHAASEGDNWHVISQKVKARDLYTEGNSIHEWGWHPPELAKAGPGAARVPAVAKTAKLPPMGRSRSVTRKQGRLVHQSTGATFTQGRARADTRVVLEDFLRSARHQTQAEDIRIAGSYSVPLDPAVGIPDGHVIYNPAGLKVPRALREDPQQLALDQMTPRELGEHLVNERRKTFDRVFPKTEADLPTGAREIRTVDKKIADAIAGDLSMPSTGVGRALGTIFDTTNNLNKAALIYLKGSYIPLNFAGNVAFLTLHQGPFLLRNLKRSSIRLSDLDRETLQRIDHEVGGGAAMALAHEAQGAGGSTLRKLADVQGAAADTLPRRAAWIHEAGVHKFKTPEQIRALLTDKRHEAVLNQVSESARKAMVDFSNLSRGERKIVSRAIFIYPWMKGATMYAKDLALDRPIAADFAQHVRERVEKYQRQHLGTIDPNLTGLIPLPKGTPWWLGGPGGPVKRLGTTVQKVTNPTSLTPIGTSSEVLGAAKGFVTGNAEQRALPAGFLTPLVNAGVEAATHYNTFTGRSYPKASSGAEIFQQDLTGTVDRPTIPLAAIIKTALSSNQTEPFTGAPSKQRSYVGEGGLGAAVKQFFLGSARPRELNVPAAQARGREAQLASMSPTRRALARTTDQYGKALKVLRDTGAYKRRTFEPVYADAIQRIAKRNAAYAHAQVKGQYDRLLVDLDLAVKRGVMTRKDAAGDARAYKGVKDKDIENYRTLIHSQDAFGESAAAEVRAAYRDTGATWPPR